MSLAIIFNHKESNDWETKLKHLLPNELIEVFPNIINYEQVEFVVTWRPDKQDLMKFPNLKCVQSVGAGIDHLLAVEIPNGVKISRIVDPTLAQDMYEHILTCILSSMKNINRYALNQIEKKWNPIQYKSINNTSVTLLGLGKIGGFVAKELNKLGFKVKGWSNSPKNLEGVSTYFGDDQLKDALKNTDIVVNILPLTSKTERILDKRLFQFLENATLINVGRGKHLNESDLIEALKEGQVSTAYLDVFDTEPLPIDHFFWTENKVAITPHVASITNPNTAIIQVVENFNRLKNKQNLLHIVDLKKEY